MRLFSRDARCAVYDEWLSAGALARLRVFLADYRYFSVTSQGKRGRTGTLAELSGELEAGSLKLLSGPFVVKVLKGTLPEGKLAYPSGTPLDGLLESVELMMPELEPWLGKPEKDWTRLGCGPKFYPAGRGMNRHDDERFAGTFVLYAHEEWRGEWDGALAFDDGKAIEPAPNRCIFLKAGVPHQVRPGARLRASVIGYAY